MAKGKKGSASSGAAVANEPNATADGLPQIPESAFAGLREKIEQTLKVQNTKQSSKNKGKAGSNDPSKQEKETDSKPAPKSTSDKDGDRKGKKRDHKGDVIPRDQKKEENKKRSKSDQSADDAALRQEILALGGTEEDFDLLAGVDSESEVEDLEKPKNKSDDNALRKELSSLLAAAGQVVPDDIEEEEVEEEVASSETDEEGDDEDEDSQEEEISDVEEAVPARPTKTAQEAKKENEKANGEPSMSENLIPKAYLKLAVPPRSDWYSTPLPPVSSSTKQAKALPRDLVERIHQFALSLLEDDNKKYSEAQQASSSSSHKFYTTIMSTGTLSDKISALTLAVQESPLHNTKSLENLIALGKKRSRAQAVEVLRSLKDMFAQGTLLPGDRRLRSFANQPSLVAAFQGASRWTERDHLPGGLQNGHLIVWAYENFVKDQYFEVLKILEVWCSDEIEFSRSRAVSYVYELLKEKPEQEANLLRLLVNKLGDPAKKIASRASYLLLQLEQAHALMKPTIITAVEEVLFRPGQSQHTKYYAIITLNQTVLSVREEKIAAQLLNIYFTLFVALLKPAKENKKHGKFGNKEKDGHNDKGKEDPAKAQSQGEEMREKLISGVLTGVNRSYPFTNSDSDRLSKHIDTLFRITHSSNFNTSIQALMLIQQLTQSHQVSADRFYRTLYESLLDPRVATSSKQSMYLNLLYKSLKNDLNVRRVKAFVKRIVQVLGLHQPAFICGILYMIRELEKTFTGLQSLFDQAEDNESDEEEVFRDVPDEDDEPQDQPKAPEAKPQKTSNGYDPRKRDPEHSNADRTCIWELLPYLSHFHPSVSVNAEHLLDHKPMSGKPDLTIHTLTHFLDRFVYRAPKASVGTRGASIMQPLAGGEAADRLVGAGKFSQHIPLNSEAFWKKQSDEVAAEDVFFHEYFNRVGKDKDKSRNKKKDAKDTVAHGEEDAEGGSEDETEIWKALVDSRPELEADDDDDLDMDDLESEFDEADYDDASEGEDEGVIFNDESDNEDAFEGLSDTEEPAAKPKAKKSKEVEESDDDEDAFDMDVSDDEAFVGSDEDLPSDVEMDGGVELPKDEGQSSERKKRRKLKHLPTFASAEDYAALLGDEDDGM